MTKFLHLSLLICCLAAHCLVALCGPKDRRFREIKTIKHNIAALQQKFDELKASVVHPEGGAIERCGSNQIKFTFSGDDGKAKHDDHDDHGHHDHHDDHGHHDHHDDHSHHDDHDHDEDVHVNVNLRFEDFHHGGIYGPVDDHNHKHSAHCKLGKGDVYITQNAYDRFAKFEFSLNSLDLDELDVHVHESGDLSENCKSLGGHYDPIDKDRDVGDIGTIQTDGKEDITAWFNDTKLSLVGPHSILGRSIVGHDRSGKRLICCVIGRAADDHDHHGHSHHGHGSHDDHDHKGDDHDHKGDDHHYP